MRARGARWNFLAAFLESAVTITSRRGRVVVEGRAFLARGPRRQCARPGAWAFRRHQQRAKPARRCRHARCSNPGSVAEAQQAVAESGVSGGGDAVRREAAAQLVIILAEGRGDLGQRTLKVLRNVRGGRREGKVG